MAPARAAVRRGHRRGWWRLPANQEEGPTGRGNKKGGAGGSLDEFAAYAADELLEGDLVAGELVPQCLRAAVGP